MMMRLGDVRDLLFVDWMLNCRTDCMKAKIEDRFDVNLAVVDVR